MGQNQDIVRTRGEYELLGYSSKAVSTADTGLKMVKKRCYKSESLKVCCPLSQCELFRHPSRIESVAPLTRDTPRPPSSQQAVLLEDRGQEGEVEGRKLDSVPVVELVLKLHPGIKRFCLIAAEDVQTGN